MAKRFCSSATAMRKTLPLTQLSASQIIQHSMPSLRSRFDKLCNKEGILPLIPAQRQETLFQNKSLFDDDEDNRRKRRAAVLVLLCSVQEEVSILLTQRAEQMSTHSSQMAFAGGHFDEQYDDTLIDTALREASEELLPVDDNGDSLVLTETRVHILGEATPLPSLHGTPVTPILGVLQQDLPQSSSIDHIFPGNPAEVRRVLTVPLVNLLQTEQKQDLPKRRLIGAPVYPTEYGDIWGLTAFILQPILHHLYKPVFLQSVSSKL